MYARGRWPIEGIRWALGELGCQLAGTACACCMWRPVRVALHKGLSSDKHVPCCDAHVSAGWIRSWSLSECSWHRAASTHSLTSFVWEASGRALTCYSGLLECMVQRPPVPCVAPRRVKAPSPKSLQAVGSFVLLSEGHISSTELYPTAVRCSIGHEWWWFL